MGKERERKGKRETERQRETARDTERQRETQTARERQRQRQRRRETGRQRQRETNQLTSNVDRMVDTISAWIFFIFSLAAMQ